MGEGEKPLLPFRGATLIEAVIARARPQVGALALNPRIDASPLYARFGLPLLADAYGGAEGPMGGLIAGLDWAVGQADCEALATFPADTPFLPRDLVVRLAAASHGGPAAVWDGVLFQSLCALWPVGSAAALRAGVAEGRYSSIWRALEGMEAAKVAPPGGSLAFLNVNTPSDLARAEALAAGEEGAPG